MPAVYQSPIGSGVRFTTNAAAVLNGGLLYTYTAGTTTNETTYIDSTGNTANANPIVLDSTGLPTSQIWLNRSISYKFVLKTSAGVTIGTWDNLVGVPSLDSPTFTGTVTIPTPP